MVFRMLTLSYNVPSTLEPDLTINPIFLVLDGWVLRRRLRTVLDYFDS